MAENEKLTGVPIDDDDLDGVAGGVNLLPLDGLDEVQELLKSGELNPVPAPGFGSTTTLLRPDGSPGTVGPLDSDTMRRAEEFRQGMNLGGLPNPKGQF